MLDVQAALDRAGIPGYRSAYRAGEMEEMPPCYVAWAQKAIPSFFCDDVSHGQILLPTLHLVSLADPMEKTEALLLAMLAEGFQLSSIQDSYDADADVYVIVSEWRGDKTETNKK